MELKGKKIFFLGDSITEGHGVVQAENIFWNRLAQNTGCISVGYGVGGSRLAYQQGCSEPPERMDMDFPRRAAEMEDDPDVIVVFGGTNDYGHGNAPLGTMADRDKTTFYGACHELCRLLLNKYPTATVVFMTPLHRLYEERQVNEIGVRNVATLSEYCDIIRQVAGYYALPVLDLYNVSGMQPKVDIIREKYMPDGLHPNDDGHAIIASRLEGFLKAL